MNTLGVDRGSFHAWSPTFTQSRVYGSLANLEDLWGEDQGKTSADLLATLAKMRLDMETVLLLSLVALFGPIEGAEQEEHLKGNHNHFNHLLKMYVRFRSGPIQCEQFYNKFILNLKDVSDISQLFRSKSMQLSIDQIELVKKMLVKLDIVDKSFETNSDQLVNLTDSV